MSGSGTFESHDAYLTGEAGEPPAAKRPRYGVEDGARQTHVCGETEIVNVDAECEGGEVEVQGEEEAVHTITVPQTQFEIEINSQPQEEVELEGEEIQSHELSGPAFAVIQDSQELTTLDAASLKQSMDAPKEGGDDGTLNAIGRALIQMQQQQQHGSGALPSSMGQGQFIITSSTESGQGSTTPLYVMIPPSNSTEILQAMGQSRPIVPKLTTTTAGPPVTEVVRKNREAQRKATHNEVERRRRDRINDLIKTLAQVVPGCQKKDATTGNIVGYVYSKGTVLDKTVEYLKELLTQNEQLAGTAKLAEKSANALSILQNQITVLEKENAFLRAQIIQLGIDAANNATGNANNFSRQLLATPLAQSLLNTTASAANSAAASQTASMTQTAAQQLLISLAQSLTNSPLLTSLAQSHSAASASSSPLQLTASTSTSPPPSRLTPTQLTTLTSPLVASSLASQLSGQFSTQLSAPNSTLSSLVQTLASIASTTTTQANPIPRVSLPQTLHSQGQLSASAATNLLAQLNTLLMTQNMLASASAAAAQSGVSLPETSGLSSSVLSSIGIDSDQTSQ